MEPQQISVLEIDPFIKPKEVKQIWNTLLKVCPHSFFLSWAWISTWLTTLDKNDNIVFVYGCCNEKLVFGYFYGFKWDVKQKLIFANRGYLNSTGISELDEITIEYNGILLSPEIRPNKFKYFTHSQGALWEELVCPAVEKGFIEAFSAMNANLNCIKQEVRNSYWVDLEKVRQKNCDYLPLLSKNKRAQLRQSLRKYGSRSSIKMEQAKTIDDAIFAFKQLEHLHQKHWQQKGEPGSFNSKHFCEFHIHLIKNYFECVSMLTIKNSDEIIGYLYNFTFERKVLFYQNGFNYSDDNQKRPGLLCHYLAINYYAEKGYRSYDFLAGNQNYKKSLSTDSNKLYWVSFRKKRFKFYLQELLNFILSSTLRKNTENFDE